MKLEMDRGCVEDQQKEAAHNHGNFRVFHVLLGIELCWRWSSTQPRSIPMILPSMIYLCVSLRSLLLCG
jgi:hypothetical protein